MDPFEAIQDLIQVWSNTLRSGKELEAPAPIVIIKEKDLKVKEPNEKVIEEKVEEGNDGKVEKKSVKANSITL